MVNGNYRVCSETTPSEKENHESDTRTVERKYKRKQNRSANELYKTLNMRQIDNETDSVKYERRIKEPRLLRYVSSDAVKEHYVNDQLESYDEPAKKHTFTKKAKNPIDGANHYIHSRSSSNCSSPAGNLPTISEHAEQYGTFRVGAPFVITDDVELENKLDRYFGKPREDKYATKVGYHGTHPDSLCRVPMDSGSSDRTRRALRLLRWPACLILLCITLALFIYFVMPDSTDEKFDTMNTTDWKVNVEGAHSHHGPVLQSWTKESNGSETTSTAQSPTSKRSSTKTPEIDFYSAKTESYSDDIENQETIPEDDISNGNVNLPIQPVFPTYISPEVQYGNEKADDERRRTPKLFLAEVSNPEDISENPSKPHITQKPEKPLAIYFQHGGVASAETINLSYNSNETNENDYYEKITEDKESQKSYLVPNPSKKVNYQIVPKILLEAEAQTPVKTDVKFTSGHSKLFGISIEDAAKMQSTTPNSVYNTRVSPTLPVLRDLDDATAKYPMNINNDGQPQCRSTRLALCRGVLPYDLASAAVTPAGIEMTSLVAQLERLVETNCSNRVRQFACALLEPECSPPPYPPRLPCYHLCTAINEDCEGLIPHDVQPVFQCNLYPHSNCITVHSPCNDEEFQCSDGACILKNSICDGRADCPAGDDEESCSNCRSDEFSCPSGGCVVRRWLCDGYTDCPNGEDESEAACDAGAAARLVVGEQSEASDPAPARLPHPLKLLRPGDSDELLMTSDSGNAYRRNYTRPRPSLSRLTPYSRKLPQNSDEKLSETNDVFKSKISLSNNLSSNTENNSSNEASIFSQSKPENVEMQKIETDAMNLDLLMSAYEDILKVEKEKKNSQKEFVTPETGTKPVIRFEKTVRKLEKMMQETESMTKTPTESSTESAEGILIENLKAITKSEELLMLEDIGLVSAHASPCPSGELRCVDGRCITLAQLCDGTIDCSDHADEENCYT